MCVCVWGGGGGTTKQRGLVLTGHKNNTAQLKAGKCPSSISHFLLFNCCYCYCLTVFLLFKCRFVGG